MIARHIVTFVILGAIAMTAVGCVRLQPLHTPSFQVATTDSSKIQEAIRQALLDRHWSIIARRSDGFDAEYRRTPQMGAKIRVTHAGDKVAIQYLDSSEMEYSTQEGFPEIHKRYNVWVANLERDIQVEVGRRL